MIDYLSINGGRKLQGRVAISGAKNAALPLLFASLVTGERCVFNRVPNLDDVAVTVRLLQSLGAEAHYFGDKLVITAREIKSYTAPYGLVKALRASFWVLGPLLARVGEARVSMPGGDAIGTRPVDLHIKGLMQMGADINMEHGIIVARAPGGLYPAHIVLDYPSVGATHNLLMAAALVPGETVIDGAAREPEVVQVAEFLSLCGVEIIGAGTSTIKVCGKRELKGAEIEVIGDRIEAATYLTAGAVTAGEVEVSGINPLDLESTLDVFKRSGCSIRIEEDKVLLSAPKRLHAVSFATAPFPGVATDVQPLLMAAMCVADGTCEITETVFQNRFGHVAEYRRFGSQIDVQGRVARICGVNDLSGAPVEACDIRAAAGLVLHSLAVEGNSTIAQIHHLDRGYENLVEKFKSLGADIRRISATEFQELVVGC